MKQVQHMEPVWRDLADHALSLPFMSIASIESEQVWARKVGCVSFELCCIPLFAYNVALGDVVRVKDYTVTSVEVPSGRFVFRAIIEGRAYSREQAIIDLQSMNVLTERFGLGLLAIDARDENHAQDIADWLQDRENSGLLTYETGRL